MNVKNNTMGTKYSNAKNDLREGIFLNTVFAIKSWNLWA